jgi:hypothetical protein
MTPDLTAFFTRTPILTLSVAINSFSAKATGHTVPSSGFSLNCYLCVLLYSGSLVDCLADKHAVK